MFSNKRQYTGLLLMAVLLIIQTAFGNLQAKQNNDNTITEMVSRGKALIPTDQDSAMTIFTQAFKLYENDLSDAEKYGCADAYLQAGNISYIQRNYILALQLYISGLKICEQCSDKSLLPRFYNNIGSVYGMYQDYESAINLFERGVKHIHETNDTNVAFNLYINLSGTSSYISNNEKAQKYYDLAFKTKHEKDSVYNFLKNYHYSLMLIDREKYDSATVYLRIAEKDAQDNKLPLEYICSVYEELYSIYNKKNQIDSMFYYMEKCRVIAEDNNYSDIKSRVYKRLSDIYDRTGQYNKALEYKGKYLNVTDSIFNQRQYYSTKNIHLLYESDRLQQKIAALDLEKEHKQKMISMQRIIIIIVSMALLSIIFLLTWIYGQNKKLQMSYRNLFKINEEIIASEKKSREIINEYEKRLKDNCTDNDTNKEELADENDSAEENDTASSKYMASRLSSDVEQRILTSIRNIMENTEEFCNEDFSLDKLAEMVESNSKYVSQVINKHYNKNFSSYVNEYRIRKACTRLTDTGTYSNYTIQAIAESVGYKSHSTFVKIFRKVTGITPSIYRNMSKEEDFHLSIQE